MAANHVHIKQAIKHACRRYLAHNRSPHRGVKTCSVAKRCRQPRRLRVRRRCKVTTSSRFKDGEKKRTPPMQGSAQVRRCKVSSASPGARVVAALYGAVGGDRPWRVLERRIGCGFFLCCRGGRHHWVASVYALVTHTHSAVVHHVVRFEKIPLGSTVLHQAHTRRPRHQSRSGGMLLRLGLAPEDRAPLSLGGLPV